ncbi:hypothetical protein H6Y62_09280 [Staphylococcus lugdunensis]|jgi:hypothetical protein|uniref:hypothetical protein n=1 Tax=Staphylococcus TaxID=1279 RepID=UPI00165BF73A|nr:MULTISPECIES: hypothetical protein [Staphylococcus]MCI2771275.1 hypothetical protein [Staphylococcus warneri]MCI2783025.1 hypothetical protein [Staphylococcus warneri]QNQ45176.1 hypothetical protein IAR39_03485 [Staphylococcus warneri]QRF15911.1 hypothetical protein H6Y62_09280 [Staphylococcus lugdunensis]
MEWKEFKFKVVSDDTTTIPVYTEEELTERLDKGLPITKKEMEEWSDKSDKSQ